MDNQNTQFLQIIEALNRFTAALEKLSEHMATVATETKEKARESDFDLQDQTGQVVSGSARTGADFVSSTAGGIVGGIKSNIRGGLIGTATDILGRETTIGQGFEAYQISRVQPWKQTQAYVQEMARSRDVDPEEIKRYFEMAQKKASRELSGMYALRKEAPSLEREAMEAISGQGTTDWILDAAGAVKKLFGGQQRQIMENNRLQRD